MEKRLCDRAYDYDVAVIGLGPAGMAVSIMGSEMGLNVLAVERHKIGGECMNVGCIPSKSLLKMAAARHAFERLARMELSPVPAPSVLKPFERIRSYVQFINEKKTVGMFKKVNLLLGRGSASFVDPHTIEVDGKRYSAKCIFICAGTRPALPPVPGLEQVPVLTNENVFELDAVPRSMTILGGGAIGCEMAQAFARLGCKARVVHMDAHLIPVADDDAGALIEKVFAEEGIEVLNGRKIARAENAGGTAVLHTDKGERLEAERVLVAAGRAYDFSALKLENAGVGCGARGIEVDKHLRTSQRHIYAAGDCNGHFLLTHAAMHQGMIALMNSMMPGPFKLNFKRYAVPWTVFTEPAVSAVGATEAALKKAGTRYERTEVRYEDYGAAIAEDIGVGFVKVLTTPMGRILGAEIVGEGSGEMIGEWALAVQKRMHITEIMFLQHSFPTMSFLSKRASETWMMKKMESPKLRAMCRWMFRA